MAERPKKFLRGFPSSTRKVPQLWPKFLYTATNERQIPPKVRFRRSENSEEDSRMRDIIKKMPFGQQKLAMWYRVLPGKLIRVVVTRDPKGYMKDGAYFCTNTRLPVRHILETFARRWSLEVAFRDMKQELGLGEPQNGWWRRKKGRGRKKAGPQPKGTRGKKAVLHTAPLISCVYGIVVAWYIRYGDVKRDVETARRLAPWYAQKTEPSFADMLNAARRELWDARLLAYPALKRLDQKVSGCLVDWLVAA